MLIIFDVDGTLCDTKEVEGRCYVEAIENVSGHSVASIDWSRYPEATSSAITQHLLSEFGVPNGAAVEKLVLAEFVARLDSESRRRPDSFRPTAGALELFENLGQREGYRIAIATGCWHDSAMLKLKRSGFRIEASPWHLPPTLPGAPISSLLPLPGQRPRSMMPYTWATACGT